MLEWTLHAYKMSLGYAQKLMEDLPDEKLADQPAGIRNHAAWQIGHLVSSSAAMMRLFGREPELPEGWSELFGMGSKPTDDRSAYPTKDELMSALRQAHERISEAARSADPALFDRPPDNPRMAVSFPTVGHIFVFMATMHGGTHLGQLSAWRKAMGLPQSVLGF